MVLLYPKSMGVYEVKDIFSFFQRFGLSNVAVEYYEVEHLWDIPESAKFSSIGEEIKGWLEDMEGRYFVLNYDSDRLIWIISELLREDEGFKKRSC